MTAIRLHTFFRSSAAYRVRIGLAVKQLSYVAIPVHLRRHGGEHRTPAYLALNPQGLVPALEVDDVVLSQSLAILEYLDERRPEPPLLPAESLARAMVRSMAQAIACDIHPLNNLRVLQHLRREIHIDQAAVDAWARHWISTGFRGLEESVRRHSTHGRHMYGDQMSLADICLVPQMFNAVRVDCDLSPYPRLNEIAAHLAAIPAVAAAHPSLQPDAEQGS